MLYADSRTSATMSYAIPEPFVWDESFKVFYEKLDEEHKGLFRGIFDVAGAKGDGGKLANLQKLVKAHFDSEEALMKAANFSDFASHKGVHDDFLSTLNGLSAPVSDDTVNFAKNWLVNHIKGTDFLYKGKL
jgi:hemerythrin family non-heme iron protein